MKKLWLLLRRITWLLGVLLLVGVMAGAVFVRTERFRELVRDQLVTILNETLRGEFTLGRVEGSVWNNLTLHDLVVTFQDTEVLRIPRLTASYNPLTFRQGRLQIAHVEVVEPMVRLVQDPQERWTLEEAFSSKQAEEPPATEATSLDVLIETVALANARIEVTFTGQETHPYRLTDTNMEAHLALLSHGTEVQIRHLNTQLQAAPLPPVLVGAALTYQDTTTPATVHIANLTLDTPQSHLRLTGDIHDVQTLDTTADLVIDTLTTAEIKQLVPTWPLTQDLSGTVSWRGPLSEVRTQVVLTATDAHITGDIRSNLNAEPFSYQGTMTITGFDTQKMLQRPDVGGIIDGTVEVRGSGTAMAALEGKANLTVHALEVSRWQLGTVTVGGTIAQQRGTVTGTLASTFGQATWHGTLDGTEALPRYQMSLAVEHLNIKKAQTGGEPLTTDLNATATIAGKGFALAEIATQAEVTLRPSTIGPVAVDRGRLAARLTEGQLHITEFTLDAKDTTATVRGDIGTSGAYPGQLTYDLHVGDVAPWLSLAEQQGTGTLHLTGKAQGSLDNLQLQGELRTQNLRVATTTIQDGRVAYQLENIGQPQPAGTMTATLRNIDVGVMPLL